jgi:hypothetical protein
MVSRRVLGLHSRRPVRLPAGNVNQRRAVVLHDRVEEQVRLVKWWALMRMGRGGWHQCRSHARVVGILFPDRALGEEGRGKARKVTR